MNKEQEKRKAYEAYHYELSKLITAQRVLEEHGVNGYIEQVNAIELKIQELQNHYYKSINERFYS